MIETAASVNEMSSMRELVDFFSVGSNDLVQSFFNEDRMCILHHERVYDTEFLCLLKEILINAGNKEVRICGQLPIVPGMTEHLIKMGYTKFTVSPYWVQYIKNRVAEIAKNTIRLIAIEGIDGVGKTSVAKELSRRIGFRFVEKALRTAYNIDKDSYVRQRDALKGHTGENHDVLALFFLLNNMLCVYHSKQSNIVADRFISTNYFWYGDDNNQQLFDAMLGIGGKPLITVILDADKKTVSSRILNRASDLMGLTSKEEAEMENDLLKASKADDFVPKVEAFLIDNNLNYIVIDTTKYNIDGVVAEIMNVILKL
jgi:thymidylate kinase